MRGRCNAPIPASQSGVLSALGGYMKYLILLICAPLFANIYCAKYSEIGSKKMLIHAGWETRVLKEKGLFEHSKPRQFLEDQAITDERLIELCHASQKAVERELNLRFVAQSPADDGEGKDEVFTLIQNGPPSNRIDLVFMGDGYLESEKDKFLADMKRLTAELFDGKTFVSYLPIFNVHAVFRASNESGIGNYDRPKNTAYKLYRLGNTLRAIYTGDGAAAHNSCSKAPGCDYPILIGNDPYYGGLGGEFSISTSSPTSGMVVLRHELGHSVGDVGEEYDGGGYFGANHADSLASLGWKHWLSGKAKAEPAIAREISWPWVNLSAGPYTASFNSDGLWSSVNIQISVSGAQTDGDLILTVDGQKLPFKSPGTADRAFHSYNLATGFNSGAHALKFEEGVHDGDNWVSNISVHEFKSDYHFDPRYIGAYPLFAGTRAQGFRPTHDTCLMRNMRSERFCPVCQENNWLKFFRSITMIDDIIVGLGDGDEVTQVTVKTQNLGQFSKNSVGHVAIRWFRNGNQITELDDKSTVTIPDPLQRWEVEVQYQTPEVREDSAGALKTRKTIPF